MKFRDRWRFFLEHAGYSVPPGRVVCAAHLARNEQEAEDWEIEFRWEFDDVYDDSFVETWPERYRRKWHSAEHECLVCLAVRDGHVLSALCGIFDPDDDYRRVVEAELAGEALDQLGQLYAIPDVSGWDG